MTSSIKFIESEIYFFCKFIFFLNDMSSSLQLAVSPQNQGVLCQLSWSGAIPLGVIEYLIFYYAQGSRQIKSLSTTQMSAVVPQLVNGTAYILRAVAYQGAYQSGTRLADSLSQTCIPGSPPQAPTNVLSTVSTTGNVMSGIVKLSWTASVCDVNYPVQNYKVYSSTDNANFTLLSTISDVSFSASALLNGQTYYFKVSAVNQLGESLSSTPISATWMAPSESGGSAVVSYTIQYSLDPTFQTGVSFATANQTSNSIQSSSFMIPFADLTTSTGWYYFQIATNTAIGSSAFSQSSTISAIAMPAAVQNFTATNLNQSGQHDSGTITLSWQYSIDNTCPLLGYIINYLDDMGDMQSIFVYDTTGSPSFTITALTNGFQYFFSVFALNVLGSGAVSDIQATPSSLAQAPTVSVSHLATELDLSWNQPNDMGSAITGYNVYKSLDGITFSSNASNQSATSYSDTGLTAGTLYYYQACAVNSNGQGILSSIVSDYPSTIPQPPDLVQIQEMNTASFGQELRVSWSQSPVDLSLNGGSPILNWSIQRMVQGVMQTIASIDASAGNQYQYTDTGLVNGQSYQYFVQSSNRDGQSASSTVSSSLSPSGLPDAPIFNVLPSNSEQLQINYQLVSVASGGVNQHPSDEGSSVSSYNLYRNGVLIYTFAPNQFSFTDSQLINGEQYEYSMSSVNSNGEGSQSQPQAGIPSNVPDAPQGLMATHGNATVYLAWSALNISSGGSNISPSDEGSRVMTYRVYQNGVPVAQTAQTSYMFQSLRNGNAYSFAVSAVNSRGEGQYSTQVPCTPSTSPSAVQSVVVQSADSEIIIDWQAPPNDQSGLPSGGLAYTYSIIVSAQDATVIYQSAGLATPHVEVAGLVDNMTYNIQIWAANGVDSNFNYYNYQSTVVPAPKEISGLTWLSSDINPIAVQWSYDTVEIT
jgi:fibronectin type 3 domain-containing protein